MVAPFFGNETKSEDRKGPCQFIGSRYKITLALDVKKEGKMPICRLHARKMPGIFFLSQPRFLFFFSPFLLFATRMEVGQRQLNTVSSAEAAAVEALQDLLDSPSSIKERKWQHQSGYLLAEGQEWVNLEALHRFLSTEAYWSIGISKERVALAVRSFIHPGIGSS